MLTQGVIRRESRRAAHAAACAALFLASMYACAQPCTIDEAAMLVSPTGEQGFFGWSSAIDGDRIVCGDQIAFVGDGFVLGGAFIYQRSDQEWLLDGVLMVDDRGLNEIDGFGWSVDVDGDRVIVGAIYDDEACGVLNCWSGAAYIYDRIGGRWVERAKLMAFDGAQNDFLGEVVAVSGDLVAVGAPADGSNVGSVYVFERAGNGFWVLDQKLTAPDPVANGIFGASIAIEGNTIVIGASNDAAPGPTTGAAYVFERVGTTWVFDVKLTPSDGDGGEGFGSVGLSGSTILVGARNETVEGINCGAIYVFERIDREWVESAKLVPPNPQPEMNFGTRVALDQNRATLGALPFLFSGGEGTAFVFERTNGVWTLTHELQSSVPVADDGFGGIVDVSGESAIVTSWAGSPLDSSIGACYVFDLDSQPSEAADLTCDGVIDASDLGVLLLQWGQANGPADLNEDGVVDGADLGELLLNWTP